MATLKANPGVTRVGDQYRIRCVLMRGGTSRAVFLRKEDLPGDAADLAPLVLGLFGSPDDRQIDGLGGAHPLTSKLALIGPPTRADADVDYTFGQVHIDEPVVDFDGTCGNIIAAVGPFAVDEGLVRAVEPTTRVRIHQTNTGTVVTADVPIEAGRAQVEGDCEIPGVPGSGAPIWLDFGQTSGGSSGGVFPTGRRREELTTPFGKYVVTLMDVANPCVFVSADQLIASVMNAPDDLPDHPERWDELESIRAAAAVALGFVPSADTATKRSPAVPKMCVIAPPTDYRLASGRLVLSAEITLRARSMTMQRPHPAYQSTGAVCTAIAALLEGTVVHSAARAMTGTPVAIGHPSGVMRVDAVVDDRDGAARVLRAAQERTARRLMEGFAYVPISRLSAHA